MISVIIPCYNYGHLISETIRSVAAQTYPDWEIIVVDDGSADNTEEVMKPITAAEQRISYYRIENGGPSAARNFGLQHARGEYIQFLDADDLIQRRKFEEQANVFKSDPAVDIVYTSFRYFDATGKVGSEETNAALLSSEGRQLKQSGGSEDFLMPALKGQLPHLSTYLFKKGTLDKNCIQWDTDKRYAEDLRYLLDLIFSNVQFRYVDADETLALVRWHESNASRNIQKCAEGEIAVRKELQEKLSLLGNQEYYIANEQSIKSFEFVLKNSWRKLFLSGGPFDFIKKGLRLLRMDKLAKRLFYRDHSNTRI